MSANLTIVSSRELFSDLYLHKLTVRLIFFYCTQSKFPVFQNLWNNYWLSDSVSTELTKGRSLLKLKITRKGRAFTFFLSFGCRNKCCYIRVLYHEVECIRASSFKLDRTRRLVAIEIAPLLSDFFITFEHRAIKLDECFGDDWLIFTLSPLNAHHGWKGAACSNPFIWITFP